jgi:hypothetical protein
MKEPDENITEDGTSQSCPYCFEDINTPNEDRRPLAIVRKQLTAEGKQKTDHHTHRSQQDGGYAEHREKTHNLT